MILSMLFVYEKSTGIWLACKYGEKDEANRFSHIEISIMLKNFVFISVF